DRSIHPCEASALIKLKSSSVSSNHQCCLDIVKSGAKERMNFFFVNIFGVALGYTHSYSTQQR
ncbi:MAG: hypothetical protein ACYTXT_45560, partial [Nostoc sp.]